MSSTTTLTASQASYTLGDYTIDNNDWGAPDIGLVNGVDYTQSITYTPGSAQSGVDMSWSYPNQLASVGAYGYPEIYWGNQLGVGPMTYSTQISNLKEPDDELRCRDRGTDLELRRRHRDLALGQALGSGRQADRRDHGQGARHLGRRPAGRRWHGRVRRRRQRDRGHPSDHGGGAGDWTFVTLDETTDNLSGSIDFASILRDLVSQGVVSSSSYVSGVSLGAEPITGGTGTLDVNNFSVSETLGSSTTVAPFNPTDFHGSGVSDVLLSNTAGAVVIGALSGGQETYTQVGGLRAGVGLRGIGRPSGRRQGRHADREH